MEKIEHNSKYFTIHTQHPAIMNFPVALGDTIDFPEGIPGFEHVQQYEFRSYQQYRPFLFMNAVGDDDVGFVCADVFFVYREYEVSVSREVLARLQCGSLQDLAVLSIVTVGESAERTTANLLSPILINVKARKGLQIILENSNYEIRYPMWDNLKKFAAPAGDDEKSGSVNTEQADDADTRRAQGF